MATPYASAPPAVKRKTLRSPGQGLDPARLYARADVERELGCGKNLLTDWIAAGLPVYGATKIDLFLGSDVIAFAVSRPKNKTPLRESRRRAEAKAK